MPAIGPADILIVTIAGFVLSAEQRTCARDDLSKEVGIHALSQHPGPLSRQRE